jgi:adenosylhomocysteinase
MVIIVDFKVKDQKLAPKGALLVEWAAKHMPVLAQIRTRFEKEKPLANFTVAACLHVTKETLSLLKTKLQLTLQPRE